MPLKKIYRHFRIEARKQKTKKLIQGMLADQQSIKLDLGGGNRSGKNGWLTIDLALESDLLWDLREGIPFPDQSVSEVYSSHLLEHLTIEESRIFLKECYRVLKPGGKVSMCVPDASIYIRAYALNKDLDPGTYFTLPAAWKNRGRIDYINYMAYMNGDHKYMYDSESLMLALSEAGFKNVQMRDFDSKVDMKERDYESIYAIGSK